MKKAILTLALSSFFTIIAIGQNNPPANNRNQHTPAEQAERSADMATKKLALSSDQKLKWEAAARERAQANAALRSMRKDSMSVSDKKELRRQMKANNDKFDATVASFLTADQKVKWDEMKKERKEKRKGY
jgi:hypothetical protein